MPQTSFNLLAAACSVLLILFAFSTANILAQPQVTIDTKKNSFSADELVEISGKVEGIPNQPVAIEVKDPDGNPILLRVVMTDDDGNYVLKFKVPSSAKSGNYEIAANTEVDGQTITQTKEIFQETQVQEQVPVTQPKAGGGCLIATATFGTELSPQVQLLRELRDNTLFGTNSGAAFMAGFNQFYYVFSPAVSDLERQNHIFRETVKITLIPLMSSMLILDYADVDSEQEILGFGIGVILLNIGMYIVAPTFILVKLGKIMKKS